MLNSNSKATALSQRLHEQLLELITETEQGERLPSEPELARRMGVSRATLREAMRTFETRGLIHRKQGVGTFVVHPSQVITTGLEVLESIETIADRFSLQVQMGDYKVTRRQPRAEEVEALNLQEGDELIQVTRVIEAEGRPVAYLIDTLPDDILAEEDFAQDFTGSVLDMLLRRGDPLLSNSRTEINAEAARPEVARALGIQRGDVVLCFHASLYSAEGRIVDSSHSYFLPGYFRFHVNRSVGGGAFLP